MRTYRLFGGALIFAMLALLGCSKPGFHMTDISGAMPRLDFHMTAQGKTGGSAVTVDSTMDLSEAGDDQTDLAWNADVVVHGMIASVGARLLDGFAKKQTEHFFGCIRRSLSDE